MNTEQIIKEIIAHIRQNDVKNVDLYAQPSQLELWKSWYEGKVKTFHQYTIYNGKQMIQCERASMQMAKRVCEDWADLLINEKTDIALNDTAAQKKLGDVLTGIKFWQKANKGIEKAFALGMSALVLGVNNVTFREDGSVVGKTGEPNLQVCNRSNMYPITVDDEEITECAFVRKHTNHTDIMLHLLNKDGTYVIVNAICDGKDGANLTLDMQNSSKYWEFETKNTKKWFFIMKPNIVNNEDIDSPFGISVFANAIDRLKFGDLIFDSYNTEFQLGRKRIFVSAQQQQVDPKTGEVKDVFDSRDLAMYVLPEDIKGENLIKDHTQQLRADAHELALQRALDLISDSCGFGTKYYKFDSGSIATATQVISENSKLFRTLKKHEILLNDVMIDFIETLVYILNTYTETTIAEPKNIEIKFDDSIIEDKGTEKSNDRLDVSSNIMSKAEYRAKWYNEDLTTAQKKIDEIDTLTITDTDEE